MVDLQKFFSTIGDVSIKPYEAALVAEFVFSEVSTERVAFLDRIGLLEEELQTSLSINNKLQEELELERKRIFPRVTSR